MITRDQAFSLLKEHVTNTNLIRHCLAVEATMRALAEYFQENPESWGIAGLLHDADWETTRERPEDHAKQVVEWLEELELGDEAVASAILAHNHFHNGHEPPQSIMEWSLYTCDELTGLIVASTLVLPDKSISSLTVESVLSKFPNKSFAAGVDREKIQLCEDKLGIPLEEFAGITLQAMQAISTEIGL